MNKKVTTMVGIALGASLAAGFGIYKYFSKKRGTGDSNDLITGGNSQIGNWSGGYIGNGLTKSMSLYGTGGTENELVGGGLYKA